jgi:hypothetical protein
MNLRTFIVAALALALIHATPVAQTTFLPLEDVRPGMIGVAKIAIDERRLVSIWMRPVIEWWRLASWRWMP